MGVQRSAKRAGGQRGAEKQSGLILKALKGGILGLVITIMSILAFAILVKKFGISDEVISAVNQAVKVASIFMAAYASSKNSTQRQILSGAAAGCMYVLLGYLTFSLIQSSWGDVTLLLADLAMGAVVGMLTAMVFTRILKSENRKEKRA